MQAGFQISHRTPQIHDLIFIGFHLRPSNLAWENCHQLSHICGAGKSHANNN